MWNKVTGKLLIVFCYLQCDVIIRHTLFSLRLMIYNSKEWNRYTGILTYYLVPKSTNIGIRYDLSKFDLRKFLSPSSEMLTQIASGSCNEWANKWSMVWKGFPIRLDIAYTYLVSFNLDLKWHVASRWNFQLVIIISMRSAERRFNHYEINTANVFVFKICLQMRDDDSCLNILSPVAFWLTYVLALSSHTYIRN